MSVEDVVRQAQGQLGPHGPGITTTDDTRLGKPEPTPSVSPTYAEVELLESAASLLADRGAQYGPPSDHHTRTAAAWSAVLGWDVTPRDVAVAFVLDKLVRSRTSPKKRDHYEDIANYAAIAWGHADRE